MNSSITSKAVSSPLAATPHVIRYGVWRQRLLIGVVMAYAVFLVVAPLVSLTMGAFREGVGAVMEALSQADVLASFWRTLLVSLIVVTIHAIFGTLVAWVMVRHEFPGRDLLNGLIDMPFAVNHMRSLLATTLDIKIAFACRHSSETLFCQSALYAESRR